MKRYTYMLLAVVLSLFSSMESSAQQVRSFEQLQILVKPGDNIDVIGLDGKPFKARIAELTNTTLRVTANGASRDFLQADVLEIRQRRSDSLGNGAVIGALSGFGFGAVAGALVCYDCRVAGALGFGGIYAGIGAGIGVGVDALIRSKQTIYRNGERRDLGLRIQPVINRNNKGIAVSMSF